MRAHHFLILAVTLSLGCQAPMAPTGPERQAAARRPVVKAGQPTAAPNAPMPNAPAIAPDPTRQLGASELAHNVTLIGKVKLLSDRGLGLISNNAGNLISNNGGGIISANGGSYRLQAAAAESLLTDATIELLDAEGQVLVGPDGQPVSAVSDGEGGYRLEARLPEENLVMRVRLGGGGELLAMLALAQEAPTGPLTIDLDTASSFSAAYVLERYVKGSRQVYDKLPLAQAEALAAAMEAASASMTTAPSYEREAQVAAAQALRSQAPQLDRTLEEIKLLLIGQENLGNGLKATEVAITTPVAIIGDAAGQLFVAEHAAGRIRKIGADGVISAFADDFDMIYDLDRLGDDLVATDRFAYKLKRVKADGTVEDLAGNGLYNSAEPSGAALAAPLGTLFGLGAAQDGRVHFAQTGDRLLSVGPDGQLGAMPAPAGWRHPKDFAVAPDGTMAAIESTRGELAIKSPGGAWQVVATGLKLDSRSRLIWEQDGAWLLSETLTHRVRRFRANGENETVAGTGTPGTDGDGGAATSAKLSYPAGLWRSSAGSLYIADYGNGLVRLVENGRIRTVAGTTGAQQQGDAQTLALNGPFGLTVDPQGRLVIAEGGTGLIKRLENGTLTVIAGTTKGYSGDGGPATEAQLESVTGIAYAGDTLYVLCHQQARMRRIGPDGLIETVGGPIKKDWLTGIATHPDGRVVVVDSDLHVVRLLDEASGEILVGEEGVEGYAGDGGPATEAQLFIPTAVAFGPDGALYVADSGNGLIRRVDADGTITPFAGLLRETVAARGDSYVPTQDEGKAALGATMIGPGSMVFDDAGNMYVAEIGSLNMRLSGVDPAKIEGLPTVSPRIRKITPQGTITTVAGPGGRWFATSAEALGAPMGLAIDGEGRLIISDAMKNQLRILPKGQY